MGPRANISNMKQCLVVSYINPANRAPRVLIGHAPGIINSHTYNRKTLKDLFSETMRATAYIFSM